jgi:predicted nucleotidyltransferase component of viral defense system
MIDRRELLAVAQAIGLQPQVVEKDYVLGWILAGINAHAALTSTWVFKGGTCLKKCYFETYRFSEDLDFTVTDAAKIDQGFLIKSFTEIAGWVYEHSGIELPAERLRFDVFANSRGKPAAEGRVYYRGPIAPASRDLPRIKLDLTSDEIVVLDAVVRDVAHPYTDQPEEGIKILCYAYEEVFGERVRALGERARPRDLYDVINLYRHDDFQPAPGKVLDVLRRKCTFKNITVPTLDTIRAFFDELAGDWDTMLGHQLPALPQLNSFWDVLPEFFAWLAGGARPTVPAPYPLASGEAVLRPALGAIGTSSAFASSLEIIRFAAANRLTVEIDYVKENGEHTTREIEAYSLRSTKAGHVVLHAFDMNRNDHRSYRTERIRGARATGRTFVPRYAIELTPSGSQSVPSTSRAPSSIGGMFGRTPVRVRKPARPHFGVTYVFQCPVCSKKFERRTYDSMLRPHKNPDGWDCPGRAGIYVGTK